MQLQKKRHAHEKEMQQQKLQHDKHLEQELDVVHQQKDLQVEDLLAEGLQVLLAERLQEELLEDLLPEEEDVNRLSLFFYFNKLHKMRPINFVPKFQ
ncbi:MAG: hypothetical protein NPMRD2_1330002 [Nitrosopumilales archaeon]|nr:MAG: hypothetical protein NPMRD2_1330002 [Nitrosopumilales archaeon]